MTTPGFFLRSRTPVSRTERPRCAHGYKRWIELAGGVFPNDLPHRRRRIGDRTSFGVLSPLLRRAHPLALLIATLAFGGMGLREAVACERANDATVAIRATGTTLDGIGAGTIVAVRGTTVRILTAKHVATFGPLTITFEDGTRVAARLLEALPDRDLAIVEAEIPQRIAGVVHSADLGRPLAAAAIHLWRGGSDAPAPMTAAVGTPGADLPDGAANGRYAFACARCHEGDSGAGLFDASGHLVGVYIGYFGSGSSDRISVAEDPLVAARIVRERPFLSTIASSP